MPIVVPNGGEVILLSLLVNRISTPENLVYRLFTNNYTPAETDSANSYVEAVGGGYEPKALTGANWTATAGAPSVVTYAPQTWQFTGALTGNPTIYGYFATRQVTGDLVLAESFPPYTPATDADVLTVVPRITGD